MTSEQCEMIRQLEDELRKRGKPVKVDWVESTAAESRGFIFGLLNGVTLTVAPNGLMNIPSVRSYHPPRYPSPVVAAACADELWAKQKRRDDANPELAKSRKTGHLGPIIGPDLRCRNVACPCNCESQDIRQRRERSGFNTDRFRCW
jgi:hypothetical protein